MTFVCDEGVDRLVVLRLRSEGHEVVYIAEVSPSVTDDVVLEEANRRGALLVTRDKDFGELVFRLGRVSSAVVLLRLPDATSAERASLVAGLVREHDTELLNAFTVLSRHKVRIRSHGRADD